MENSIKIFENDEFGKIEVLMIDSKPYFPATECAKVLGYAKPENAILRHCKGSLKRGVLTNGGNQTKTYIPEGDLYRLIIRSKLPAAVKFEAWVCDEILPSIRTHGAYITQEILERIQGDSEFINELLHVIAKEREKNDTLLNYVEHSVPKIRYYDLILQCPNKVQASIIAKDYGMTCIAFNKLLHSIGIQFKIGQTWLLYGKYANNGYTITKTYLIDGNVASIHTYWTQKGRRWLYEQLLHYGLLPLVERIDGS